MDSEEFNPSYLRPLLDCMQEGAEICDSEGNVVFVNRAFSKITGIKPSERIGCNLYESAHLEPLVQAMASGQPVFAQKTWLQGLEVIANAVPVIISGKLAGGVVTWVPATDTIRLDADLAQCRTLIENLYARLYRMAGARFGFDSIIGNSKVTRVTVDAAKKMAKTDTPVLILGESGCGKELYAQAIHHAGRRRDKPFIRLTTAAQHESLLEDELFGQDKGAYPGAVRPHVGCLELANGGTLYIDEIANLNLFLQDKLLRVLEHWEFFRLGGCMPIRVDVRIIAASNRDLRAMVQEGRFREQLYFRLSGQELPVPALRQRREDIPHFVNCFVSRYNREFDKQVKGITAQGLQVLYGYDWPGNVRELKHVIERAMIAANEPLLSNKHLASCLPQNSALMQVHDIMPLERMEEILLRAALARYGESLEGKKKAARALNISLATLYNKLKKYDV